MTRKPAGGSQEETPREESRAEKARRELTAAFETGLQLLGEGLVSPSPAVLQAVVSFSLSLTPQAFGAAATEGGSSSSSDGPALQVAPGKRQPARHWIGDGAGLFGQEESPVCSVCGLGPEGCSCGAEDAQEDLWFEEEDVFGSKAPQGKGSTKGPPVEWPPQGPPAGRAKTPAVGHQPKTEPPPPKAKPPPGKAAPVAGLPPVDPATGLPDFRPYLTPAPFPTQEGARFYAAFQPTGARAVYYGRWESIRALHGGGFRAKGFDDELSARQWLWAHRHFLAACAPVRIVP